MTRNLVVHFRRLTFLIVPSPETLALAGRRVRLHESADGEVEIRYAGQLLPYTVLDKQPLVAPGEVVENKRLGAVLSVIYAGQEERTSADWPRRNSRFGRKNAYVRRGPRWAARQMRLWSPPRLDQALTGWPRPSQPRRGVLGAIPRWPISLRNSPPNRKRGAKGTTT